MPISRRRPELPTPEVTRIAGMATANAKRKCRLKKSEDTGNAFPTGVVIKGRKPGADLKIQAPCQFGAQDDLVQPSRPGKPALDTGDLLRESLRGHPHQDGRFMVLSQGNARDDA